MYPEHPYTLRFLFAQDLLLGRAEQAASDDRRYLVASGTDSGRAADIERRLRDPALRKAVVHQILVGNPRREAMNKESLFPRSGLP